MEIFDRDVRHFIYRHFAETARPPSSRETAVKLGSSISEVEAAFSRLAAAHHIALAPGSYSIWMAHPYSGVPTNFILEANGQTYHANCMWDMFGIAALLKQAARGHTVCGCGACEEVLEIDMRPGEPVESAWIVHFVVPARRFWDEIGYT